MKRKVPPAVTANVLVVEGGSGAEVVEHLLERSAALTEAAPLIDKAKKRTAVEDKTLRPVNEKKKQDAQAKYQTYRDLAGRFMAERPQLRRANARNRLAKLIRTTVLEQGGTVSVRTIYRALDKKHKK